MKIFALGFTLLLVNSWASAQPISNGHFTANNGNDITVNRCATFSNGSVVNWKRSNGAPQLQGNSSDADIRIGTNPGPPFTPSQGFYGNYTFKANTTYFVEIGLKNWYSELNGTFSLEIVACNGLVPNTPSTSPGSNFWWGCNDEPSAVTTTSRQTIGSFTSPKKGNVLTFTNGTTQFDQLWVFMKATAPPGGSIPYGTSNTVIDYIAIREECKSSTTFGNGQVPVGTYHSFNNIYAGSSYSGGAQVFANAFGNVEFLASQSIDIRSDFIANPTEGNSFIAAITPCGFGQERDWPSSKGDPDTENTNFTNSSDFSMDFESSMTSTEPTRSSELSDLSKVNIQVYPNPATTTLWVKGTENNIYQITEITGRHMLEGRMNNNTVNIEDLVPGSYILQLTDKYGTRHYSKFTKQ